jgi:RNAse H domain protein, YqgF family
MVVAIDVGLKRIGVAFGYENGVIIPQNAILRHNRNQAAHQIAQILEQNRAQKLIVGVPLGGSSEDEMRRRIAHFVGLIGFYGEIIYIDESFSSFEATSLCVADLKKKDGKLDSLAAMKILERFFEI